MGVFGFFTNLKITPAGAPENNTSVMVAERRAVTVNAPAAALLADAEHRLRAAQAPRRRRYDFAF